MKLFFIAISLFGVIAMPLSAFALEFGSGRLDKAREAAGYGEATKTTFASTLGQVVRIALGFLGIIFTMLTLYAGFLWMTARGNESQVEKAQTILRACIIGFIIIVSAYSITNFVVPRLIERAAGG